MSKEKKEKPRGAFDAFFQQPGGGKGKGGGQQSGGGLAGLLTALGGGGAALDLEAMGADLEERIAKGVSKGIATALKEREAALKEDDGGKGEDS